MSSDFKAHQFAGGSIVCRLAATDMLGWPLSDKMEYNKSRPPEKPLPDDNLVTLVMYYDNLSESPGIFSHRRMRHQRTIDVPTDAWRGAYREHRDGRGYTFEYAFDWSKIGIVPPKPGEMRANTWNIHFSDGEGQVCTGQIAENIASPRPEKYSKKSLLCCCYYPPTWGKAVFE